MGPLEFAWIVFWSFATIVIAFSIVVAVLYVARRSRGSR